MKSLNSGDANNSCAKKQLPGKEAQAHLSNKNIKSLKTLQKTTKNFEQIYGNFELIAKENYAIQCSKDMRYALKIPHFSMKVNDIEGMSVLTRFSAAGYNDIVKLLLTVPGIDSEDKDHWGYTAINWASREGHAEVVRTLLTVPGINVNTSDSLNRWTPLMNAPREGHYEVAKLLLAVPGIKISARDIFGGNNSLEWALKTDNNNIAKLIRSKMNK